MSTYELQKREERLREDIIRVCRLIYNKGFVAATDGNVSARLDERYILATPSGFSKGFIEAHELIVVDMEGRQVSDYRHRAQKGLTVTSEILLHLEVYRQRQDVGGVVHAHPPITVALSIAGIPIARCLLPEVLITLGDIPITEYATPASPEGAEVIRPYIGTHDALVLPRHGSVTVGKNPFDAYLKFGENGTCRGNHLDPAAIGRGGAHTTRRSGQVDRDAPAEGLSARRRIGRTVCAVWRMRVQAPAGRR